MTTQSIKNPHAGVVGSPNCWHGVIRVGGRAVWQCEHSHGNRDKDTYWSSAAIPCAKYALKIALADEAEIAEIDANYAQVLSDSPRDQKKIAVYEWAKSQRDAIRAAIEIAVENAPKRRGKVDG